MVLNLNFREKTSLNVITNILRTLAMALIGIFMVPYYVGNLGVASYAILPLATTMAAYIQIISDSIANASVRYNTLAINSGNADEANVTLNSSFFGLGKVCLAIAPLGLVLAIVSPAIFSITGSEWLEVQVLFGMIILSSLIVTVSTPFNGVFYATNDLYLMYLAKFAYSIAQVTTIILLFVISTPSLVGIGVGYFVSSLLIFILLIVLSKRIQKSMKISRKYYDRKVFKKIGNLGFWTILEKVGGLMYIQLSMILVNLYLGSEVQGGFAMIATIVSMVNTSCYALVDSVDPFIYKAYSNQQSEELAQILYTATKIVTITMAFPVVFVMTFSEEFLTAWVGSDFLYLKDIMIIGLLGNYSYCAVTTLISVPRVYLKLKLITAVTFIVGIANAVLTVIFLGYLEGDVQTAILVWAVCMFTISAITETYDASIIGTKPYKFIIPMALGYAIIAVCFPVLRWVHSILDIPPHWVPLIALLLVLMAAYFVITYTLLFTRKEKQMVKSLIPSKISKHLPEFSIR